MILIIDNYDSFTYNLYQSFAYYHPDLRVVRNDKISIDEIQKLPIQGIVLSPGPGRPENAGICVELIRSYIRGDMTRVPMLGVCLGHQAMTIALGGKIIQSSEICHGKSDDILHSKNGIYRTCSFPFKAGRYHSLIAERKNLPKMLLIEAENSQKMIMGIKHREFPLYGVQFHPESILTPDGKRIIQEFVALCS